MNQYSDSEYADSEVDEHEAEEKDFEPTQGEEIFQDDLYCVACNKFFNSESAKLNHEASKKHKQNTELLKAEMNSEESIYQQNLEAERSIDAELSGNEVNEAEVGDSNEEELVEDPVKKSKGKKSKKKNKKIVSYEESEYVLEKSGEDVKDEAVLTNDVKLVEPDDDWSSSKKPKKSKTKSRSKADNNKTTPPELEKLETLSIDHEASEEGEPNEHRCATCNGTFPSNNKLYAHLKKTNHSIYLAEKSISKKKK